MTLLNEHERVARTGTPAEIKAMTKEIVPEYQTTAEEEMPIANGSGRIVAGRSTRRV